MFCTLSKGKQELIYLHLLFEISDLEYFEQSKQKWKV